MMRLSSQKDLKFLKVMSTDGEEYTIELGADLKGANLCCAVWNDETVFPEGFEIPEKSGT